jgi:hypothetical protein
VGEYDFNEVSYEPNSHLLEFHTNIPLEFAVEVEALLISVEEADS